ncbi:TPA: restriction endonuclease subunit S [Streptococcus suis]
MPNKDRNIPKRRFKEFENEDAWELRKLGEYSTLITKGTTPRDKSGIGVVNFVKVENLVNGDIIPLQKIQLEEHEGYLKRSQLIENDILFSIAGTLGRTAIVKKSILPANTNQALSIIRGYEFDRNFLVTILRGVVVREFIKRNPTIGAQPNLSLEQVSNLCFLSPCSEEQSAIGTFFSTLDRHITLHQRKLDKLKHVKQAYLSEMFPAEGERVPKRRFPGFTDDWELRKLGEVADVFDGTHQTPRYTNQGVMFLSVEDINTLESEKYISSEDFEKEFKIFPEFNDVLMTRIGDIGTSNIVKTNDKIAYYVSLALIKPKKLESHFLNSIIQSKDFQNELWKRTLHIAFPKKINKGEISEVNLKFPTLPEQKAIGTFFSTLDQQITLHQRKLEKLKNLKKALLNELFV